MPLVSGGIRSRETLAARLDLPVNEEDCGEHCSKFSICVTGEGVVASEASFLAFKGASFAESMVVAFGDEARAMAEHTHPGIQVVTPMQGGLIIDSHMAAILLKKIARKAGIKPFLVRPKAVVAALFGATEIERKAFADVAASIAPRLNAVIHEPLAAAHGIPEIDVKKPRAQLVLDVGDGATEAMIVSMGRPVLGRSMRFGGADVDHMLLSLIRKNHALLISYAEARRIKESLVDLDLQNNFQTLSVKGMSLDRYLPREIHISMADLQPIVDKVGRTVADFISNVLENAPPDLSGDLIENGIYLCGGGSHMVGLRRTIQNHTHLPVHACDHPDQTVIQGIHNIICKPVAGRGIIFN